MSGFLITMETQL